MKRLLASALVACLFAMAAVPASAQSVLGLNAGATYSKLSGNYFASGTDEYRWGFLLGGHFVWLLSGTVELRLEGNWLQKGGKGTTTTANYAADITMDYIEFPLLLTAGVPIAPTVVAAAHGGMAWGYRVTCRARLGGGSSDACIKSQLALDPSSTEWSVPLGATLGANIGSAALLLDVRYSLGLTNLAPQSGTEIKTRTWRALVRLGIPIM